jgi:tetratricopeptide (TPR) repeat protein
LLIQIAAVTQQLQTATNNRAALFLMRGELHRHHQSWAEAEADYAQAAQLDPNLAAVDFCRARLRADSGQLEAARALFDKGLTRCPTNGDAFIGRARVLAKLGQRPPAVADYQRGLELLREPAPDYFLELAQALTSEGQVDEALRSLDAGIKRLGPVTPLQVPALELELGRKNYDAALARLETLLARALRKESWLARRGDILLAAGRPAEARQSYEAALGAVRALPPRLQQAPAVLSLVSRVNAALTGITNAPTAAKVAWNPAPQ